MLPEVIFAGAVSGKVVGELVDAVKALIKKGSSFQSTLKKIDSTLETITPHLDDLTRLDQILNQSGNNDLVALVREGKELVDKCSKVDRFNFIKVPKYENLLVDYEKNLSCYFSRETFLAVKEMRGVVQVIPEKLEEFMKSVQVIPECCSSRERRDYNDLETEDDKISSNQAFKQIHIASKCEGKIIKDEAECSTSRERRDHQGNDLDIPIKLGYQISSSSVPVEENIVSICARDLAIEHIKSAQYWKWSSITETSSNPDYEVAELLKVWILNVCGYFGTQTLQHGIEYKVAFEVMLIDSASGWEAPVKLKLILPDGSVQERGERIKSKPRNQWLQITVGNFTMSPSTIGTIEILLEESTKTVKKNGILIKGVVITEVL